MNELVIHLINLARENQNQKKEEIICRRNKLKQKRNNKSEQK